MIKHQDHFHGSDLELIEKQYGIGKDKIISFSANVNPLGISPKLREALPGLIDCITGYPDREYTALRRVIAAYCDCSPENIIVGNGSSELISLCIQNRHPARALIIGPTYSEYEREVSLCKGMSRYFPLSPENEFALDIDALSAELKKDIDLLILCNPNNPTSGAISLGEMRLILDICKRHGIFVIVDETYIEFVPDYEQTACVPLTAFYNNMIILRGISKFFSAPGLRLGYAITGNTDMIELINSRKNPWSVNSLAEAAGRILFTDLEYIKATKELIDRERRFVAESFKNREGYKVYEPKANFVLIKLLKASMNADILFDRCIREGMMIRNCASFPFLDNKYFRICFMKHEDNERLIKLITESEEHNGAL